MNPKPTIIGLAGQARSGKDTVATYLNEQYGFAMYAFANILKDVCHLILNDYSLSFIQRYCAEHGVMPLPPCCAQDEYNKWYEIIDEYNIKPDSPKEVLRPLLQYVGTDSFRKYNMDSWTYPVMLSILDEWENGHDNFVISDVRFVNEEQIIHRMDGKIIHIIRESGPELGKDIHDHESERQFNLMVIDRTILSSGTDWQGHLYNEIDKVVNIMKLK
jgi:hypothetical protein